ncbi:MAG: YbjN domain-containing protein [Ilumatobacteraceae bacterium]|nr:YbjN domain-containing protein [Ilumatobacteraceae bacterium]MBL6760545.1 YbjN domain-containing protein [Ilumatobacteraceae bacterium]MDA0202844.1 YbjN domain-containing protein [Actinomycetota bacterium]MDA3010340.1 YbjN domain-containing protein [Actinomycetota bacterium]
MSELRSVAEVADLVAVIDAALERFREEHEIVLAIDRGTTDGTRFGEPRWYVRMAGEEKDVITVWLTLGQRTLRYETYVLPAPEENVSEFNEQLLRRNDALVGAHFSIGAEDAVYLRGELVDAAVDSAEVDRILGTLYATVEQVFRPLLRIGFASRVTDR